MSIFLMIFGTVILLGGIVYLVSTDNIASGIVTLIVGACIALVGVGLYGGEEKSKCESGGGEYKSEFSHYIVGYKGSLIPVYDTECVK